MAQAKSSSNVFALSVKFKHANQTTCKEFLDASANQLGKKDFSRPLKVLTDNWVDTVGDLRLLIQEGQLRSLGLPLRLCVWMEEELSRIEEGASGVMIESFGKVKGDKDFVYQFDFDENGIIYYKATAGGTKPWTNPATSNQVIVSSSGLLHDSVPIEATVGRETVRCVTKQQANAWFAFDLVDMWVIPTHYTVRHYSSWDTEAIRNWNFEGSNDGSIWTIIQEHRNDESLFGQGASHTWPIKSPPSTPFRIFRLRMTGLNSNQHLYLACSGFELYGTVSKKAPKVNLSHDVDDQKIQVFTPTEPFDTKGIIYHLGTLGGKRAFTNPMVTRQVVVSASSVMHDSAPIHSVVGREVVRCVTRSQPNSWISIDFQHHRVCPTHYSIRHYSSWDTEALRHWEFQGSQDGSTFVCLRKHENDESLQEKGQGFTWSIPEQFHSTPFRVFKILQTDMNSNKHYYLSCSGFEVYGKLLGADFDEKMPPLAAPEPMISPDGKEFVYQSDLDENGIIHYIATHGKTRPWTNPADAGLLSVTASSLMHDSAPVSAVVGHDVVRCVTKPTANSFFIIDLIDKCAIPTAYTIRHYSSWDVEAVRNWNFEGSNDGRTWKCIRKHTNDESLHGAGAAYTWTVPRQSQSYRMFRIKQWGLNSNKHNYLAVSGFELYGILLNEAVGGDVADESMTWDETKLSKSLLIDHHSGTVSNTGSKDKWQMARSVQTFSSGKQRAAVRFSKDSPTTNTWKAIVGVIPASYPAGAKEWVGALSSWGYIAGTGGICHVVAKSMPYGQAYGAEDVVGIEMDFDAGTIEFYRNGRAQGIAFKNLKGPVQIAVSITGTDSSMAFADPSKSFVELPMANSTGWSPIHKSPFMSINGNDDTAINTGSNNKWQSARTIQSFSKGKASFSVRVVKAPPTPNNWQFIVGVVPPHFPMTWVGAAKSWGYIAGTGGKCYNVGASTAYGEPWGSEGDVITVQMDFDAGTIEFLKNGISQGVAFNNLVGEVFGAVSITATQGCLQLLLPKD